MEPRLRRTEYRQTKNVNLFNGKGARRHEEYCSLRDEPENEEEHRARRNSGGRLIEQGLSVGSNRGERVVSPERNR